MLKNTSLALLLACAGMSTGVLAAPPVAIPEDGIEFEEIVPASDENEALARANKLGLNTPANPSGLRGLGVCPTILSDGLNCHPATLTLGASFSGTRVGAFRVMENVTPTSTNATRICWIGRYADRVAPSVPDESFLIRIFADDGTGFPDLSAPVFQQTFRQSGAAGVDLLEMDCLDGENCPGTSSPAAGGHYVYSAEVTAGFPMTANTCYWVEIACDGSSQTGLNWGWVGSTNGTDLASLQAIDGAYNLFTRTANDRALCISGGVNAAAGNCTIAPQPPICGNDPANGIPYAGSTTGGRASWPGSVGVGWTPFQRADSFTFDAPTTVTNVCFRGFWNTINSSGGAGTPAAPIPENPEFRVAYFAHNPNDSIAANTAPIAEFAMGDPGVSFVWDGTDVSSFTHPPVNFEAGTCYWISIGRIQSNPPPGQTVRVWAWRLTPAIGVPTGDNRTGSRSLAAATPAAWGLTIFRTAFPACDPINSNYHFLFNSGPTTASACVPQVCSLTIPPDATPDAEPGCTLSATPAPGCNAVAPATPVFTPLACGETVVGSSSHVLSATTCGTTRDNDWYHLTVTQEQEVTLTITSQFGGFAGYGQLQAGVVNPTGVCSEYTGSITPLVAIGQCTPATLTRTLQPGTWIVFVAPNFTDILACDGSRNMYTISAECTGGPPPSDCNNNGVDDATEIAGGARDCFDPLVLADPNTMGGPDGTLDECQCVGNWNRDVTVNSGDISTFLTSWLNAVGGGAASADINCDGVNNSGDISAFLTSWLAQVQGTIPTDGCP